MLVLISGLWLKGFHREFGLLLQGLRGSTIGLALFRVPILDKHIQTCRNSRDSQCMLRRGRCLQLDGLGFIGFTFLSLATSHHVYSAHRIAEDCMCGTLLDLFSVHKILLRLCKNHHATCD